MESTEPWGRNAGDSSCARNPVLIMDTGSEPEGVLVGIGRLLGRRDPWGSTPGRLMIPNAGEALAA